MSEHIDAASFVAGRDLAVELLLAGNAANAATNAMARANADCDGGSHWLAAEDRRGRLQDNYALPYLERLRANPELIEGFAAVLSDLLGSYQDGTPSAASYGEPTFEEMR